MTVLDQLFSYVCGSNHLWAPGGEVLPFCQRCTGLYVGCVLALALYVLFGPRATSLVLWIHGGLLLLMVPFGYHWVPQNGVIRLLTGQLFAFGLVYYLLLSPAARLRVWSRPHRENLRAYLFFLLVSIGLLQIAVQAGGVGTGAVLSWVGFAGLVVCAGLVIANLALLPPAIWRALHSAPASVP